ncbi:MAG: glycosyltransferase family 2 protein [Acidobacteriaceae bacterium]|nr:glycosyltransferase family 2 protein [Acidobacteriaceae bacterium]
MREISVVIPTHNRAQLVTKHLFKLTEQSLVAENFEVIVVADGCTDDTATLIRRLVLPYRIKVLQQNPGLGAAAARNRGATAATSGVILFLDDDMEPGRDLLKAHVECHRANPGSVVLGYFPMHPPETGESPFTKFARLWWAEKFAARSSPDYRFSFYDLCTGNVSIAKDVFEGIGGFDVSIGKVGAGEDYELGYRLIRRRVRFVFSREAASIHHSGITSKVNLRRAREDGYGHSTIVRKHPELFWEFKVSRLSRLANIKSLRPLWVALWKYPALSDIPIAGFGVMARLVFAINGQRLYWKMHSILNAHAYWRGARDGFGCLENWERFVRANPPYEPVGCREVDLEVTRDLDDLDEFIRKNGPADAIRVLVTGEPVGRIDPWPPGEALTSQHLRTQLVAKFSAFLPGELLSRRNSRTSVARAKSTVAQAAIATAFVPIAVKPVHVNSAQRKLLSGTPAPVNGSQAGPT